MDVTERFAELAALPESETPLDEAALLIAAHARPGLDVPGELSRLDVLAERCGGATLDALVRTLFVDLGFSGNQSDYYDPRNSYLDQVMARRAGIPITLSVLTVVVGRRLGVPLDGVGMPGHFLVRDRVDRDVFVDPFGGGRILDRAGCRAVFAGVHGPGADFDLRYLEPVGTHTILARMLTNLRNVFTARGDRRSLLWAMSLRQCLPDAGAEERAELAGALASVGRFDVAATEYDTAADALGGTLGDEYRRSAARLRARLN